jgi:hypothetical protein
MEHNSGATNWRQNWGVVIVEALLALIRSVLIVISLMMSGISREIVEWRSTWGNNPLSTPDYHDKKILKVMQEVGHYLAVEHSPLSAHPLKRPLHVA